MDEMLTGVDPGTERKLVRKVLERVPELFTMQYCEIKRMKKIGSGSFGTVFHCVMQDGSECAVKRMYPQLDRALTYLLREIVNLSKVNHENVLCLRSLIHKKESALFLVTDYVNGFDADIALRKKQSLLSSLSARLRICVRMARGLRHLHIHSIMHRDIKLANVLLSKDLSVVKLCDFGFSLNMAAVPTSPDRQRSMTSLGTDTTMAPEVKRGDPYTFSADVYSLGCGTFLAPSPAVE
eukprot:TRINITY_DN11141_c1_g1_i1.p1 TRINITY_DN11141_c1_g1~~TRINITY_DN11141_c1_g1_i1.p1  ORF type:complete len:238 (+),score=86.78 TRINITY_DN11141_c1_g1_i1:109-822(+)